MPLTKASGLDALLPVLIIMLTFLLLTIQARAQYLGATCGYDYNKELTSVSTSPVTDNTPLYNPPSGALDSGGMTNDTWGSWVEQMQQAGLDFICPNLKGSQYKGTSPANIAPLVSILNSRGLTSQIKIGAFDDNAASWTATWNYENGRGYNTDTPFDIGDTNNWVYIYDLNYKIFFQTVPDTNLFKINGRPVIIIWTGNSATVGNEQGNYSRAMTYVRQKCQADFGFNPFIIVNSECLNNDTTMTNAGIVDACQGWSGGGTWTLKTYNNVKVGAAFPGLFYHTNSAWRDPNHGVTFDTALSSTVGNGALLTLVEGFTDWAESAALHRVRNLDPNGNPLNYTNTYYDYPNQRLQILRKHSQNPFFGNLKFEAEGCDTLGGAAGGNGKINYYRNGNIAIELTSDTGGGHDVGWMQSGEWLEWTNVPLNSSPHFTARIATPTAGRMAHIVIDGVAQPSQTLPTTGAGQNWTTYDFGVIGTYTNSYHTVRIVFDNGGVNFNWWQLSTAPAPPSAPTGLTATIISSNQINLSWTISSGATNYNVKRATVNGGPYTIIATNGLATTYNDTGLSASTTYYYVVSAFNTVGESPDSAQISATILNNPVLLSQGRPVTADSSESANGAANGNDGSLSTRWAANGNTYPPRWWRVDLGTNCNLSSVTIDWYGTGGRSYQYKIDVSTNDIDYVTAVDNTSNTSKANTTDTFTATARYVRITVTGVIMTGNPGNASFYECLVYGNVVPPVSLTPTNIAMVVTNNTLALSWPADHLGWHLQVQTNAPGAGLGTNWVTLPGSESVTGANITINPANGAVFYRLISP
jgi:hypothetical protein